MGEVIVITSGKGGVGKTTTTANLGGALAQRGKKVVLLDADIGLRNLDVALGLENSIVYDFVDVIEEKCKISHALIKDKRYESLYMIAASQTKEKCDVTASGMKKLCEELADNFDYVLIDCPAGVEQGFKNAVAGAERAIVVSTADVAAVRDADRVTEYLEAEGIEKIELIVNKIRPKLVMSGNMLGVDDVIEILAIPLIGVVPDDEEIIIAANDGRILSPDSKSRAGKAYRNIADRVEGKDVPLINVEDDGTLRYKLRRLFKRKKPGGYFRIASQNDK